MAANLKWGSARSTTPTSEYTRRAKHCWLLVQPPATPGPNLQIFALEPIRGSEMHLSPGSPASTPSASFEQGIHRSGKTRVLGTITNILSGTEALARIPKPGPETLSEPSGNPPSRP